ncbi:hypothetical protein KI688_001505 [Linnemannia hyalina]|uniref:Uncharacterized protein n=1 Tax=Linnemannia hyalina TaxID=64524 RepID=A0A9P7XUQ8_9FUNG|nr:hypothetical protein KI688_001505 [Linnemannia hyalina]
MSDYYDAWSANKRKKGLGANASSSRLRQQQQQQHQQRSSAPATTTTTTTTTSVTATTTTPSYTTATLTSPGAQSSPLILDQPALPLISISPALPRPTTTTTTIPFKAEPSGTTPSHKTTNTTPTTPITATGSTKSPRPRPISAWRFSRTIFDSSLRPSSNDGSSSYVTDFDDVDEDDDDEDDDDEDDDDEDDDDEDDEAESDSNNNNNVPSYPLHVSVIPRIQGPTSSGTSTTTSTAPNFRNSLKWSGSASAARPTPVTQVQQPREVEHGPIIEQLDTPDERLAAVYSPYTGLAKSSPALSGEALLAPADHPQSTTTFNTRLYPQPILQHLNYLPDQQEQTLLSLAKTSVSGKNQQQGRRPRPWSQVIWESPLLGEGSQSNQHQQQSQQSQQRARDHLITVGLRPDTAYPALRKDMFTPVSVTMEKDKERVLSKSVRINIDGDVTSTTSVGSIIYPRIPAQTGDSSNGLTPKRELSHGRKTMNRISLGSGFYASIEPISLSAATPSTPKTRRQLVRLPARPQSVFIPSTAHHFPISGSGTTSGAAAQLSGGRLGVGLPTDQFKRQRHKSQQLEMRGDSPRAIPIPWQQLAPMGAQDNSKTFHGIGSVPASPIPILKKGGSQENTFGATTLYPLNEAPEPVRLPPASTPRKCSLFTKPNAPYMHHQHRSSQSQGQGLPCFNPSPPTSSPTSFSFSSSSQQRSSSHTPSWFLPALLDSSSSYLFKKALPSSTTSTSTPSSSSPKRATFGLHHSGSTPSPTRILSSSNNNTSSYSPDRTLASSSHLHYPRPQHNSYRQSPLQTRQSLPISGSSSSSSHYYHDSSSSNTGNQGDSLLKKSRRKLTASLTPTSFFSSITSSNSITINDTNATSNSHQQQHSSSVPVSGISSNNSSNNSTTTTKTSLWKRDSSSVLFPFSLVSYESGGLLGEIKNTSTAICTNAPSSVVAPGTPLPPGMIVSTGVPPLKDPSSSSSVSPSPTLGPMIIPTISIITPPAFPRSPGSSSTPGGSRNHGEFDSTSSSPTRRSHLASEVVHGEVHQSGVSGYGDGEDGSQDDSGDGDHGNGDSEEDEDEDEDDEGNETTCSDKEEMYGDIGLNGSIVIQKSHVAVYEINARWGSRLMMFLVTLGGIFCALSGGFCAEHHCKDLQLCLDDYQDHGDWCGPSGVDGAPYMLTVGLSMCTFGLYAMTYLRSPISRLVGYSEIDQFL